MELTTANGILVQEFRNRNRKFFKDLLEAQYLSKFIKQLKLRNPPFTIPGPKPDPGPELNLSVDIRDALLGDLLIHALGQPVPETNRPLYLNQIKESGLHIEVIKELIIQFEDGAKALKEELKYLKKMES